MDLVRRWNPKINLVSRNSLEEIWTRHILDSVQVYRCAEDLQPGWIWEVGAVFPAWSARSWPIDEAPDSQFTFVESDQRKSAFLRKCRPRHAVRNARWFRKAYRICRSIECRYSFQPVHLADLRNLLSFCDRHLRRFRHSAVAERRKLEKRAVEDAREEWNFDCEPITSLTEPQAVILRIKGVSRG